MNEDKKVSPNGSDWTRLLTDPELVSHLPQLLQTYREVPPEQREAALLQAMREIKDAAAKQHQGDGDNDIDHEKKDLESLACESGNESAECKFTERKSIADDDRENGGNVPAEHAENQTEVHREKLTLTPKIAPEAVPPPPTVLHGPEPVSEAPPFETDSLSDLSSEDRRRFHRIKCYVAVEIHIEGVEAPVWGNLANVSRGGCLVETASAVPPGKALEIGLWVASGKIWVKGVILTGIAQRTASFGVRVKFSEAELSEKQHLRDFLKFIEGTARKSHSGNAYLAQLKS
jgi:PilZ domain